MRLKLPILLTLLLFDLKLNAASNYVAATWAAVSNSVTTFTAGDATVIAPGIVYWSNSIAFPSQTYGTWRGSGTNQTKFISVAGLGSCLSLPSISSNQLMIISDFDADGVSGNSFGFLEFGGNVPSAKVWGQFRFTRLQMTNIIARGIFGGGGDTFGLIDHCIFRAVPVGTFNSVAFYGNSYYSWTNASPLGTTNQIVVEDCYFDTVQGTGNGHWDAYDGAQFTIRHCLIMTNAATGSHGYDSQVTSTRTREVYNNIWSNQLSSSYMTADRGGVTIAFSNSIYGSTPTNTWLLQYYRACNGSYQSGYGYAGYILTNKFSGTATGGSATTLVDETQSNGTLSPIHYANELIGRQLKLVSGTGSGQALTISANTSTTITVTGGTFSPAPDNTTGYEIWYRDGNSVQFGTQPPYILETTLQNVNRHIKLAATLQETLTNIYQCINLDPAGAGLNYAQTTTNTASGRQLDLRGVGILPNTLLFTNILDGNGDFGWPANQQAGMINSTKYTNSPVVLYPCYQWSNTVNGDGGLSRFALAFSTLDCNGLNYVTNLLKEGRDYYNNTVAPGYTPLVYPHPLAASDSPPAPPAPPTNAVWNVGTLLIR